MRVIVFGSRDWHPDLLPGLREFIADRLADLPGTATVVHGAARGVDRIAASEAEKLGLIVEPHPAADFKSPTVSWKRAPLERNSHMARLGADLAIGFHNGSSTGSQDMRRKAEQAGIPVEMHDLMTVLCALSPVQAGEATEGDQSSDVQP